jgi:hypothetical protein
MVKQARKIKRRTPSPPSRLAGSIPILTREARIKRQLRQHLKALGFTKTKDGHLAPPELTKERVRLLHLAQRQERLTAEASFVDEQWPRLQQYFADGSEVVPERIAPRLELVGPACWQSDLFRLASLTWSVPVSQGYGRRMRFLVWDDSNGKLIGLLGLGDPVFNLRVRDEWIGWSLAQRKRRLVDVLDAFVLGALPPYNMLLGGKLVASLIRSVEVKKAFADRYTDARGVISGKRKRPHLSLVTTTSALGRSSIYNRLALQGEPIFTSIGYTSGWGHFHIPETLFAEIRQYLEARGDEYAGNHRFGDGPNWKLRAVRKALTLVGLDGDLLQHGIAREVFVCPLASNAKRVLKGQVTRPDFRGLSTVPEIGEMVKERWMVPRASRCPEYRCWQRSGIESLLRVSTASPTIRLVAAS